MTRVLAAAMAGVTLLQLGCAAGDSAEAESVSGSEIDGVLHGVI
ncbi:MAG: hypothetical protein ACREK1_12605 [Longimicrobiales bacterium]